MAQSPPFPRASLCPSPLTAEELAYAIEGAAHQTAIDAMAAVSVRLVGGDAAEPEALAARGATAVWKLCALALARDGYAPEGFVLEALSYHERKVAT